MPYDDFMESTRRFRSWLFDPLAGFLIKLKITANHLTTLSLLAGIIALYFLFQAHFLFIIFILLHLFLDGLDGVVARLTKPSPFGDYYDHIGDQALLFITLIKIYFFLQDYYILIIAALFLTAYSIHFSSQKKYPALYVRTLSFLILLFTPLHPPIIATLIYLIVGVAVLYSLLQQLRYFLHTRIWSS